MVDLERRLRDYGVDVEARAFGVTAGEVLERAGDVDPTRGQERVVTVKPRSRGWWTPTRVAIAAGVIAVLVFLPLILAFLNSDNAPIVDDSLPQPSIPTTTVPASFDVPLVRESPTVVGTIKWYLSRDFPLRTTRFRLDGVYYARLLQGSTWWTSRDGVTWDSLAEAPRGAPPVRVPDLFGVSEIDGETFATISGGPDAPFTLLHRVDNGWATVPYELPTPPADVGDSSKVVAYVRPTIVVMVDGNFLTVPNPGGESSAVVSMGDAIYALVTESDSGDIAGYEIWRSIDGEQWDLFDSLSLPAGESFDWVYLSGGYGRLVLAVGQDGFDELPTLLEPGEAPTGFPVILSPAPPEATDFGWMLMSLGEARSGLYDPDAIELYLSEDGIDWGDGTSSPPGPHSGFIVAAALPVTYSNGFFVRSLEPMGYEQTYVGKLVP